MTVGAWIVFAFVALVLISAGFCIGNAGDDTAGGIIGVLIGVILSGIILAGMLWYYNNTAAGARAYKTQESNFNMGINRKVTVYDMEGDVIKEYTGKFDIEYDDDRILFDDEYGLRHIIYYPTGTVIVDEVGD